MCIRKYEYRSVRANVCMSVCCVSKHLSVCVCALVCVCGCVNLCVFICGCVCMCVCVYVFVCLHDCILVRSCKITCQRFSFYCSKDVESKNFSFNP